MEIDKKQFRREVKKSDPETIGKIVTSTGFFNAEEIDIAEELADEFLAKGEESGYQFIFLDNKKDTMGYSCFGRIPGTKNSFALYWIAVHENYRNQGLGKILLQESEKDIFDQGGDGIYVETSSREQYVPTRMFYEKNGYLLKTRFEDYYNKGDDLVFYIKRSLF